MLYIIVVAVTMLVGPAVSVGLDRALHPATPWLALVARWFVFWGVGVRLAIAGARQILQPGFTAREIFHIPGDEALVLVRELGTWNLAIGLLGLLSLAQPSFVLPTAIAAAIFYFAAGIGHVTAAERTLNETVAMTSDLGAALVLAV
ncbi:MAG: hypothetical protein KIS90_12605, partial [Phenylobacterium sp.]|nr:hypothetical protein [Phenylobacterium sp.]